MLSAIIAFLAGGLLVGLISFYLSRMILRAEVIDMINEETNKRIQDQDFNISFLEKKLNLKTIQYNTLVKDVNEVLSDDRKSMKDLIKKLDG